MKWVIRKRWKVNQPGYPLVRDTEDLVHYLISRFWEPIDRLRRKWQGQHHCVIHGHYNARKTTGWTCPWCEIIQPPSGGSECYEQSARNSER